MKNLSPITNEYDSSVSYPKLAVDRVWLYRPEGEWSYCHHASVTWFNGRFHAIWSNGRKNEDDVGQRILTASSEDFFHWSKPVPLVDSRPGAHAETVLTAAGFHQHQGSLVAYFGEYEYASEALENGGRLWDPCGHLNNRLLASTTTDGIHWSELLDMNLPMVPNHGPQPTASGRLIITGNIMFPHSDDPAGLTGWVPTGIYPDSMASTITDDSQAICRAKEVAGWPVPFLCEGSFFQTDDAVLHMMLRTNSEVLWLSESVDDGNSWSVPGPTEFSDNSTKFHFGRLPDGRFYYIGCPDKQPQWRRCPLILSLSRDGIHFTEHFTFADEPYERQYAGMHKEGNYGYPHTMVHDGYLYVIVSRWKESVELMRVSLSDLPG